MGADGRPSVAGYAIARPAGAGQYASQLRLFRPGGLNTPTAFVRRRWAPMGAHPSPATLLPAPRGLGNTLRSYGYFARVGSIRLRFCAGAQSPRPQRPRLDPPDSAIGSPRDSVGSQGYRIDFFR